MLNSCTVTDAVIPLFLAFQVPVDADDAEIEERILQHLAAAAAIRRSHRHARREGRRSRSAAHGHGHGHPQVLFFPTAAEATPGGSHSVSSHPPQEGDHVHASAVTPSQPLPTVDSAEETAANTSVNHTASFNGPVGSNDRYFLQNSTVLLPIFICLLVIYMGLINTCYVMIWISVSRNQSSPVNQDEAGPSDAQSFSDTIKSRLQSVSTKYTSTLLLL